MEGKASVIDKIRKLMAKAEGTTNEHEADAFMAKAQEWMIKFAIDEAELAASGKKPSEEIITRNIEIRQNLPRTKPLRYFLNTLAQAMNCRMWYVPGTKNNTIAGHESDVDFVEILFYSVQMQQHRAMKREFKIAKAEYEAKGLRFRPSVWRRNFIEGYLHRVGTRITLRYREIEQTYGGGAALALRDKSLVVKSWVDENFNIKEAPKEREKAYEPYAQRAGRIAGDQADISGGRGHLSETKQLG